MSNETTKGFQRRLEAGYFYKYLCGNGIDIGCGKDVLKITNGCVVPYDKYHLDEKHEAQTMAEFEDGSLDFAYSSNCLEHVENPVKALKAWMRIVKHGGIVFFTVPDETLYEHNIWPSTFHKGHLWSFTTKEGSKMPRSIHLQSWLKQFDADVLSVKLIDSGYDYSLGNVDQTQMGAEACVEVILRINKGSDK